jgi:hypothetical protein
MAETADLRMVVQIGQQYVGICDQFLGEHLGRPYTVPELSQFAETAISTLMASAYSNFREVLGKEAAEAWLKKTLSMAASNVRLFGADALLRFEVHIKDMPNKLHQQRQEQAAAAEAQAPAPAPPACSCSLAEDGSCPTCIPILSEILKGTFTLIRHMASSAKKAQAICQGCHAPQTDLALVTVIPEAIAIEAPNDQKEAFHQEILGMFHQIAAAHGATAIPLTEKAWKEAVK